MSGIEYDSQQSLGVELQRSRLVVVPAGDVRGPGRCICRLITPSPDVWSGERQVFPCKLQRGTAQQEGKRGRHSQTVRREVRSTICLRATGCDKLAAHS